MAHPTPAVVLLVFNRPQQTRAAVGALLRERPARLYVAGDGPRASHPEDVQKVDEVWDIVRGAPWECQVFERRLSENAGCAPAVRSGLDWFFSHEERGFIVEDDIELASGALQLAEALFDVGQGRSNTGTVTVLNTVPRSSLSEPDASYRWSLYGSSQGWGTWADLWMRSPRSLTNWREWLSEDRLVSLGGRRFARHWSYLFDHEGQELTTAWDFTWQAYRWAAAPFTLAPNRNLVTSHGFDSDATFSFATPRWWPTTTETWEPPLVPPRSDDVDPRADDWEARHRFGISAANALRQHLARHLPQVRRVYRSIRHR